MFISASDSNMIDFLGIKISISSFLLIAGGVALLVFLGLLAILLLMYLRKKMAIKGYLGFEKKSYQTEDEILQIEKEVAQIQKKFYLHKQKKSQKKVF